MGVKAELAQNRPQNQQEYLTVDFTARWGNRNLGGTSQKLGFSAYYSYRILFEEEGKRKLIQKLSNRFTLGYVEPWFLGTRTVMNLDF
ncbi:MAG: hypothetical protein GTN43_05590, partial [Candidatus Aenigmarchaeota archaeon]|nr:hypothetical protein [Candidatus Aenigmarchaeota archaeon]